MSRVQEHSGRWGRAWDAFRRSFHVAWTCYLPVGASGRPGFGHVTLPRWALWLERLVGAPAFAFEQSYVCYIALRLEGGKLVRTWWPYWPGSFATWVLHKVHSVIEPFEVGYRWNSPDSGDPAEIGFHSVSDGSHTRSPWRCYVYPPGPSASPDPATFEGCIPGSVSFTGSAGEYTTTVVWACESGSTS